MSRLIYASQPEAGSLSYTYYPAGNVETRTDARGVIVTYGYDQLNRLVSKTYSGNAPAGSLASCYQFDTATNGIGRLGFEWTQSSSCPSTPPSAPPASGTYQSLRTIGAYDAMGRVASEQQCVLGYCTSSAPPAAPSPNCASLSTAGGVGYCYDLAGNLLAYGNGLNSTAFPQQWMSFSQQYDSAGRLSNVNCAYGACTPNYSLFTANQTTSYTPFNALQNWLLGANLSVSQSYDTRLRPTGETVVAP
jgi:YD repeat-containing protein